MLYVRPRYAFAAGAVLGGATVYTFLIPHLRGLAEALTDIINRGLAEQSEAERGERPATPSAGEA
jgi:hypothetical protein